MHWAEVPADLRREIEGRLGGRVVASQTREGGFSPGLAAVLVTAAGERTFVKAIGPERNPATPDIHRREIAVVSQLPDGLPVPRFLWSLDQGPGGWVVLAFEAIDGDLPATPWREAELARVCDALNVLERRLTPSPIARGSVRPMGDVFVNAVNGWEKIASSGDEATGPPVIDAWCCRHLDRLVELERRAPQGVDGDSLVHFDTRADNLIMTPERVYVVDWPHACIGAPWVDFVWFAPSVEMQGGPDAETLMGHFPSVCAADPDAVTAVVAAVAGYFTWQSLQPPPPGLPTVRHFQAGQGIPARRWLRERTRWT